VPLRLLDSIWHPNAATNADAFWAGESTAVLLDGAAPRGSERVSAEADDTVWLVRRFVEEWATVSARAGADRGNVPARVEAARAILKRQYAALCVAAGVLPPERPFACLAIAELEGGVLDLFNMGDLTTLVRAPDGSLQRFGTSAVRELDRRALEELGGLLAAGVEPHAERRERLGPLILAHRALRNQLPGYDVLDLDDGGAARLEHRAFDASAVSDVLMMSDGFYRLVDTFERYTDATLFQAAGERGLPALLEELREVERSDLECTRHLRFKTHDDATALWLEAG
jgi:hypothetical protein